MKCEDRKAGKGILQPLQAIVDNKFQRNFLWTNYFTRRKVKKYETR